MADDEVRPVGELFSRAYGERGEPTEDSAVFRARLQGYVTTNLLPHAVQICGALLTDAGITVKRGAAGYIYWDEFFNGGDLLDILSSVTIVHNSLRQIDIKEGWRRYHSVRWREFIESAFNEENLAYELDEECGVHPLIDHEFSHNKLSTLICLTDARYEGVRKSFEDAFNHFEKDEHKQAVRSMFESLEILVRLMVECKNLSAYAVENALKPKVLPVYEHDKIAVDTISKMMDGFGCWVDSIHNYRHGQGEEEPVEPPKDFTVYVLSSGASCLRWLVGIDEATKDM